MSGQPQRIARLARDRVEALIGLVEHVCEDGMVTPVERRLVAMAAHDARTTARASDAADALGRAIGRATSARHITDLARVYQATVDELPDVAA